MKIQLSLILCLALLLGLFTGCVPEDTPYIPTGDALAAEDADVNATIPEEKTEPQQLTLAYYADRSMNPFKSTDFTNRTLFSLIYQGLFSTNRDNQAVPILCDRYSTDNSNLNYTFYIMEDATFSDGSALTIEDVFASYQAAQSSKYYEGRFTHIREYSLTEDGGIHFNLRVSMEEFPLLLDIPIVKAAQVEAEHPLGTGPYILEDSLAGAQLRRNQAWWCQSPDLVVTADSISLVAAQSTTHIRDEFEFADVGLVCADPCSDAYADYRCDYELWDVDNGIFLFLGVNVAYSDEDTFADTKLRSALTYAIDREAIAQEIYGGFADATTIPVSPNSPYYSASLASKYEYDPVRFIEAMSYAPHTEEPLELLVNKDDGLRLRTAKVIVAALQECGMDIILVEKDTRDFNSRYINGDYDLYLGQTRLSPNMDLSCFYRSYGNLSRNGTADTALYELCKDALENQGNFYNLHKAAAEDGRIVPILFCNYAVYATRGLLTELQPSRDNIFFYTLGRTDADALIPIDYDRDDEGVG